MSLPLFKLGALVVKQLSKPLSKLLKDKAKSHERFRKYFVIPAARGGSVFLVLLIKFKKSPNIFGFKFTIRPT